MNQIQVVKDFDNKKMTITREFDAPRTKLWKAHIDDTLLVQWWGPKTWPASSKSFDFAEGGHWHYYMTGPDGTQAWGWLDYITITPEEQFTAKDYFTDAEGTKNVTLPSTYWTANFEEVEGGKSRLINTLDFASKEDMQKLIEMGFEEGYGSALQNLDELFTK